jgi:hypothetical protein
VERIGRGISGEWWRWGFGVIFWGIFREVEVGVHFEKKRGEGYRILDGNGRKWVKETNLNILVDGGGWEGLFFEVPVR